MTAAAQPDAGEPLPELRGDLRVVSVHSANTGGGAVVFDPVRQSYFRINEPTVQLLKLWPSCLDTNELISAASKRLGMMVSGADALTLKQFLIRNELLVATEPGDWKRLAEKAQKQHHGWLPWLVHNYLFFKYPLLRPQRALEHMLPYLAFVYTRTFAFIIFAVGLAGLYLASRQFDSFISTFPLMMSLEGVMAFSISLAIVKTLHELGHALTAVRYGCRVPTMGVCFMVLVPMLYTDVTDAWRLQSDRKRLAISIAGLVVEIGIACVSIFAWTFLPEGLAKSVAFATATTSLILSIGINLNPFMRFDGYYILSDLTGIENLQSRAFSLGVWKLREILFNLGEMPPEPLAEHTRTWMIFYAWGTWVYRIIVYAAIALLVYHIGFKLLGIVLFLVEISFFLAIPVWREIRSWAAMRSIIIARRRGLILAACVLVAIGLCALPLSSSISIPAILEAHDVAQIYPRRAAMVSEIFVKQGDTVVAGAPIVTLISPDIEHEIVMTQSRRRAVQGKLNRRSADEGDLAETVVLGTALASLDTKLAGLRSEQAELKMVAPIGGRIVEFDPGIQNGRWLKRNDLVALISGEGHYAVRGYVSEDNVVRLDKAKLARFVPEDLSQPSVTVRLQQVAAVGTASMDMIELSSHYGGGVLARPLNRQNEGPTQLPVTGQFMVSGVADIAAYEPNHIVRGTLRASGRPESLVARAWRRLLNVLVRESSL